MGQGYISCPIGRVVVRTYTGRREAHLETSPELQPVTGGLDEAQHVAGAPGEAQRAAGGLGEVQPAAGGLGWCSTLQEALAKRSMSRPDASGEAHWRSLLAKPAGNSPGEAPGAPGD